MVGAMDSFQDNERDGEPSERRSGSRRRLFARAGTPAILITVLLVVVVWAGFLGWILIGLFGWLLH